jgi:hypothetical protein
MCKAESSASSTGGGGSQDSLVDSLASELLAKAPAPIDRKTAHPSIFRVTAAGIIPSLSTVLVQEVPLSLCLILHLMVMLCVFFSGAMFLVVYICNSVLAFSVSVHLITA